MKLFEKASWLLLLCALVTVSCVVTDDEDEDENVRANSSHAITPLIEIEDYEEFVKLVIEPQENNSADKPWLIRVYNPECAQCTILQPHWDALVSKAAEEGLEFHLGQISYYSNPSSAMRLKVGSLPTLVVVKDRKFYQHARNVQHSLDVYLHFAREGYKNEGVFHDYLFAGERPADPDIVELTNDNYDKFSEENERFVTMFYGPTCGHCKDTMPTWRELARRSKEEDLGFKVTMVEAPQNMPLAQRFEAFPWPAIFLVVDGEGYPLEEPRVKRTVEEYIEFALSDPSTLVKEEEPEPEQNEELAASEIE